MDVLNEQGVVRLARLVATMDTFEEMGIALDSPEAADLTAIAALEDGAERREKRRETAVRLDAAGIVNVAALQEQIQIVRSMYDENLLTNDDVIVALTDDLQAATSENLVVRRPGNRLVVDLNPRRLALSTAGRGSAEQIEAAEAAAPADGSRRRGCATYRSAATWRARGSLFASGWLGPVVLPRQSRNAAGALYPVHHRRAGGGVRFQSRVVQHWR